jgi:hypothetical protein
MGDKEIIKSLTKELKQARRERNVYKRAVEALREFVIDMLNEVKK